MQTRLGNIKEIHPLVLEIEAALKQPAYPLPRKESAPAELVRILLDGTPLLIRTEANVTVCLGQFRMYRLAQYVLDPNEMVPVRNYEGSLNETRRAQSRQRVLLEMFLLPAVFGRGAAEMPALSSAWQRARGAGLLQF